MYQSSWVDWSGDKNSISLSGDIYWSRQNTSRDIYSFDPPYSRRHNSHTSISSGNINLKWTHNFYGGSQLSLHTYYQFSDWNRYDFDSRIDTVDVEAQYLFSPMEHHTVLVGTGYRLDAEDVDAKWYMAFDDPQRKDKTFNVFFQDKISMLDDRLLLTLGSKFEHNHYTGWEVQPSFRVLLKVNDKTNLWGAISRAVHTPDMVTRSMRWCGFIQGPTEKTPFIFNVPINGNKDITSESLWAYELGGRFSISPRVDIDMALYFNHYNHLMGFKAPDQPYLKMDPVLHLSYPVQMKNMMDGDVYGMEVSANISLLPWWKIKPAYTYTRMHLWERSGAFGAYDKDVIEQKTPQHQFSLRSMINLPHNLTLDTWLRYVSHIYHVSSYTACDARVGWKPVDNMEISLVGRNLFDNHHLEFVPLFQEQPPSEVERSIYLKVSLWF